MKYAFEVVQTRFDGRKEITRVCGTSSLAETREGAFYLAKVTGWTPPKWWQWWRWGDTRKTKRWEK